MATQVTNAITNSKVITSLPNQLFLVNTRFELGDAAWILGISNNYIINKHYYFVKYNKSQINAKVFALYGLTKEEIAIVEKSKWKYVRSRDTTFKPLTRPFLGFVINPK